MTVTRTPQGTEVVTTRFTPEELRIMSDEWMAVGTLTAHRTGHMLRQAADDAERLDWCEAQFSNGIHIEGCFSGSYSASNLRPCASVFYGQNVAEGKTIREAIDTARKEPK